MMMPSYSDDDDYEWLNRKGDSYDIVAMGAQANDLIRQHLNLTIKTCEYVDTGYNNVIFFIDTVESSERYVLKIGGKYWVSTKTENEVKALQLLAEHTSIPVPRVLAYSLDADHEFGAGWILMTRMPGENMSNICAKQSLSYNAIQSIIQDLAEYVAQMRSNLPRMLLIGSFRINGNIDADSNGMGPWSNYEQFVRDRARMELRTLEENPLFDAVRDDLISAIKEFEQLRFPPLKHLPFVFSHGDLDIQNILISMEDPDAPRITGIIDWEWAGSLPCSEEYFTSFNYFTQHDNKAVHQFFFDEFERHGIPTPRTIEQFSLLEKINQFITNLALWDLPESTKSDNPLAIKKVGRIRSTTLSTLAQLKMDLNTSDGNP